MGEKIQHWNQYGYHIDVFDKYREAVRRSNRSAVRVFSALAILSALMITVYGLVSHQAAAGAVFCISQLAAGCIGAAVSCRRNCSRGSLLLAGYLLTVTTYALSIYWVYAFEPHSDAFWIGTLVAAGCYLYDYAWRISLLQILSYVSLRIVWMTVGVQPDPARELFSIIYLIVSLVTFYMLNRTRTTLILGKEESGQASETDLLTGLTIRIAAQQEIEEHLKTDDHGVLLLMDLDRFKIVNDRLGHQMGDKVLVDVAANLKKMFRNSDVLSRLGGDEFVVYLKSVPEKEWALQRASQVVREVRRWVGNGTTNIQVTASVGIVMTDMVARTYDDLYRAADIAMYTAKAEGGNKALFYTRDMLDNRETVGSSVHFETPDRNGGTGALPGNSASGIQNSESKEA